MNREIVVPDKQCTTPQRKREFLSRDKATLMIFHYSNENNSTKGHSRYAGIISSLRVDLECFISHNAL